MQKHLRICVASALLASSGVALAVPFNSFDPRSMGMGGAGVAVGDAATAPFFNPALLTVARTQDNFSLSIPAGARVYDPGFRDFQDGHYADTLNASVTAFNGTPTSTNLTAIANNTRALSDQLAKLSDKPIEGEAGGGLVIGIPGKSYGGAFYVSGWGAAGGMVSYRDGQTLQDFANASTLIANTVQTGCGGTVNSSAGCISALQALQATNGALINQFFTVNTTGTPSVSSNFNTNNLQSTLDVRAVLMGEMGLSLSKQFGEADNPWALGITPKIVKIKLYEYSANANTGKVGDITGGDYTAEYSNVNMDVGLAKNYGDGWRGGFVVKNIIPHTYDFKKAPTPGATPEPTGDTIKLKPQARIGASHTTSWSTFAMDLDLTANDPAGLEKKSQYLSLGGELNAWDWAQIRLGYRADLKDSKRNIPSVGLGLAPFGVVHFDLAVAKSSNEIGASARLAVTF